MVTKAFTTQPPRRLLITLTTAALLLTSMVTGAASPVTAKLGEKVCFRAAPAHQCLGADDPVAACEQGLTTNPFDLNIRYSLCEAHLKQDRPLKAWLVLDQGKQFYGRNKVICSRLDITLSNLEENSEKKVSSRSSAERDKNRARQESQRRICLRSMNGDLSLNACQELLLAFPDAAELHAALGDKLINRERPAQAITALRQAMALGAKADDIQPQLDQARRARNELATSCLNSRDLDLCNRALLVGTADEASLHMRRATLLEAADNLTAASNAILSAQALRPRDQRIATSLLQLTTDAGDNSARAHLARGQAQQLLGHTNSAIRSLRSATRLAPEDQTAARLLRSALADRKSRIEKGCLLQQEVAACQRLLVADFTDSRIIRDHITDLQRQQAKREMTALADQFVPAHSNEADKPSDANSTGNTKKLAKENRQPNSRSVATVAHSNATRAGGMTY